MKDAQPQVNDAGGAARPADEPNDEARKLARAARVLRPEYIRDLSGRADRMRREEQFRPGDIVRWKVGLRNRRYPIEDEPAVVVEVLAEPVFDQDAYFREPLNIALGLVMDDNEFVVFYFDARRFEKDPR
jgi:hypothetical protein